MLFWAKTKLSLDKSWESMDVVKINDELLVDLYRLSEQRSVRGERSTFPRKVSQKATWVRSHIHQRQLEDLIIYAPITIGRYRIRSTCSRGHLSTT